MTPLPQTALDSALSCWEWVEYVGAGTVLLGVIGEFLKDFCEFPRNPERRNKFGHGSTLVLILGLVVELLGLFRTNQISGQIIARMSERTATLESENLNLRKGIQDISLHQLPRHMDCAPFLRMLEGKPSAAVKFWYERNDDEAFGLAENIYECIDRGQSGLDLSWKIFKPEPIPEQGGESKLASAPGAVRFGPGFGIGVVSREFKAVPEANSALGALSNAPSIALNTGITRTVDPTLPNNVFVVVVGQKL
jgi:hypothetical protein